MFKRRNKPKKALTAKEYSFSRPYYYDSSLERHPGLDDLCDSIMAREEVSTDEKLQARSYVKVDSDEHLLEVVILLKEKLVRLTYDHYGDKSTLRSLYCLTVSPESTLESVRGLYMYGPDLTFDEYLPKKEFLDWVWNVVMTKEDLEKKDRRDELMSRYSRLASEIREAR